MTGSEEVAAPLFKFRPQCSIRSLAATDRWGIANFSLRVLCCDCEHEFRRIRIFLALLQICDILVRIRIRTSDSGSVSGSCYFLKFLFCLVLFEATFTSFFDVKKS